MLLTITTTRPPATDLGYLLHKNPNRVQEFAQSYGQALVFYPECTTERCTAALLLDIDPVGLIRTRRGENGPAGLLGQYVNDRPYAASSLLSVAIANVFGSALNGRCSQRPELVTIRLPLELRLPAVPVHASADLLGALFEPLGYAVVARPLPLDASFPQWGDSCYYDVNLQVTTTVREALAHLYVLIPVLDNDKHYWVGESEIDKLQRHGDGWLNAHPAREAIVHRYLRHQRSLSRLAFDRLLEADGDAAETDQDDESAVQRTEDGEQSLEQPLALHEQRHQAVLAALEANDVKTVVDLGCGEGRLLRLLLQQTALTRITGVEVSHRALELAERHLHLDRLPRVTQEKLSLLHGSLAYRDQRLAGYDAATVVEVIEHFEPSRLAAFERVLFEYARPRIVILTTPNREYNARFRNLPSGQFRHPDHRFEWTRVEFAHWCSKQAERFGYAYTVAGVGIGDPEHGAPTQLAVFTRAS